MIPKVFHFIWLDSNVEVEGKHKLSIHEYYSILTNFIINEPNLIKLHTNIPASLMDNEWVIKLQSILKDKFILVGYSKSSLNIVFDNKVPYVQHQSDILRLNILYNEGGVYMDCDCIAVNPLPEIWYHADEVVWGKEACEELSFCNNVIMAPKGHRFIYRCLQSYKDYNYKICKPHTDKWAYWSVVRPVEIYKKMSDDIINSINIRPSYDFQPLYITYEDTYKLFHADAWNEVKNCYVIHAWSTRNWGFLKWNGEDYFRDFRHKFTYPIAVAKALNR